MFPGRAHRRAALITVTLLAVLPLSAGCSGDDDGPLAKELSGYTDPGDGCAQVMSAIAYADDALKPLGQEQYQTWDDVSRSRLAAVDGTIALEERDFPTDNVLKQARKVGKIADHTPRRPPRAPSGSGPCASTAARRPSSSSTAAPTSTQPPDPRGEAPSLGRGG